MRRVIAGALVSLILVGCSSAGTLTPSNRPVAAVTPEPTLELTPAPTPTPSATPDPYEFAASEYLYHVTRLNKNNNEALKVFNKSNKSLKAAQALYAEYAKVRRIFTDSVRQIPFPPEMADHVAVLLERESTVETYLLEASRARSIAQMNAILTRMEDPETLAVAASNLIRQDLGLPPPPLR